MERVDAVVIGAGVIGLAVARALALAGREVLVLEAADRIGTGTSSRNSEVIHAGIHYEPGSLKARTCRTGGAALYQYCADRAVAHRRIGKLVVAATADQRPRLDAILARAHANGATEVRAVSSGELRELEPDLVGHAALLSPATGIVDGDGLLRALRRDAEDLGAVVVCRSPVSGGDVGGDPLILDVAGAGTLGAGIVVNCAGLDAWRVARSLTGFPAHRLPPRRLAKGTYFTLAAGSPPFRRLIYPVPEDGGLGIHLTLDLAGAARFGPDVEWVEHVSYDVDASRAPAFAQAIARYWPAVADHELVPAYAGIRPKLAGPAEPAADFCVQGPADHGANGLVNLFGIESPGLTASLALADEVVAVLTR
ncbi:NAD(P)/FAD-dependent oxidoreductase [Propionicicella superfundia]|uniref:NAD(P)/FAD-dependent oxidoreductase n=1 Tax=Propionicicella superfundia TaxID=348582 RepID=UPI000427BA06|nr:NAD(P)/FAD-dependent oxidoreductase [Propionicicella superfundia]